MSTITDLLDKFRIPYRTEGHRHTHPGWVSVDCWLCSPSTQKWKLGINLNSLACNCWTCGRQSLQDTLINTCHIPFQEAINLSIQLRKGRIDCPPTPKYCIPGTLKLPKGLGPLLPQHHSYLKNRGFDPDSLVKMWGIGGIGLALHLAWRVFIPIHQDGEIVSWTTRSISDEVESKYINANKKEEKIPLKECLLGLDYVRHSVIIVEGPLDAFRIGPGAVSTMGVNYTQEQVRQLSKIPVRVVNFDNEISAQKRALKLTRELSAWPGETYNVILSTGKDASRASQEDVDELRKRFLD